MTGSFRKGARVKWNWGQGVGRGRVAERFDQQVEREVEGARNPAYLVMTGSGSEVLKLGPELTPA